MANKISHNIGKTELVFFSTHKKFDCDLKIELNGKRLYETDIVSNNWESKLANV